MKEHVIKYLGWYIILIIIIIAALVYFLWWKPKQNICTTGGLQGTMQNGICVPNPPVMSPIGIGPKAING